MVDAENKPFDMTKVKYEKLSMISQSGAQVQNRPDGKVYVFGADDIAEEEINTDQCLEMEELRPRGRAARSKPQEENRNNEVLIDKEIQPGETIQSIALKYGCPVCEG